MMAKEGSALTEDAPALPANAVSRARCGEAEAFAAIYDRYHRAIHRYVYRLLGDAAQADDVTQETFIQAWRSLGQLRDEERLEGWLYRIASNKCLSLLRRRRLLRFLRLGGADRRASGSDDDPTAEVAQRDVVARALRCLPHGLAVCLILRHAEGFSCAEVAEILGISQQTVWTRLSRGREAFAAAYERQLRGGQR